MAVSVRNALTDVESIEDIETDPKTRVCQFNVDLDKIDIASKLEEIGATNEHVAGWSVLGDS